MSPKFFLYHPASLTPAKLEPRCQRRGAMAADDQLPLHNIEMLLAEALPSGTKVALETKEHVRLCLGALIAHVVGDAAANIGMREKITPSDIKSALPRLGAKCRISASACHLDRSISLIPHSIACAVRCWQGWEPSVARWISGA
jgi:histone H3/H4